MKRIGRAFSRAVQSVRRSIEQIRAPRITARKPNRLEGQFDNPLYESRLRTGQTIMTGVQATPLQKTKREPYSTPWLTVIPVATNVSTEQEEESLVVSSSEEVAGNDDARQRLDFETRLDRIKGNIEEADIPTSEELNTRDAMMARIEAKLAAKREAEADRKLEILDHCAGKGDRAVDLRLHTLNSGLTLRKRGVAPNTEIVGASNDLGMKNTIGALDENLSADVINKRLDEIIESLSDSSLVGSESHVD